jgi:hypothetical protein
VVVEGAVCWGFATGTSGRLSAASAGCALAIGSAKTTAKAMDIAANHRVRANRSTSILVREPIARTGQRRLSLIGSDAVLYCRVGSESSHYSDKGEGLISKALRTRFDVRIVRV